MRYNIEPDGSGHWLVTSGPSRKPVALIYGHNVSEAVARSRAERFLKAMQ